MSEQLTMADLLADYLSDAVTSDYHTKDAAHVVKAIADQIVRDPQAHADTLVAATVLEPARVVVYTNDSNGVGHSLIPGYRVVQPKVHVHEWHRIGAWLDSYDGELWLREECAPCKETRAWVVEIPS